MTLWHIHLSIHRQAARDFSRLSPIGDVITAGSPSTPPPSGGDDEMPDRAAVDRDGPQRVNANADVVAMFDKQREDTAGVFYGTGTPASGQYGGRLNLNGATYVSTFTAIVRNLPAGVAFRTRLVGIDGNGKPVTEHPWCVHVGGGGDTPIVDTRTYKANKGNGIRAEMRCERALDVDYLRWRVNFWRL